MAQWTEPGDVKTLLGAKWDKGAILSELILPNGLFPLRIKLTGPKNAEIGARFSEVSDWIKRLRTSSKNSLGYGYILREKETNIRGLSRNRIPAHAVVETLDDAVKLLKKAEQAQQYADFCDGLMRAFPDSAPDIRRFLAKSPNRWHSYSEERRELILVLKWMRTHPDSGLYLRQVDIEGLDTKYVENRKSVLAALLDVLEQDTNGSRSTKSFEQNYGFRPKPTIVRFRFLDPALYLQGLSDIGAPVEQFTGMDPEVTRVFITENEINGLCFPELSGSMVIFGLGYGVDVLKDIPWLKDKDIVYWGDIDTHGFAMLSEVRSFLPQTVSMLMNEATLLRYQTLWSSERSPARGNLPHLSDAETTLFENLKANVYGENVRFEQERIPYGRVLEALRQIT
jgi:hypothetical protein